MVDISVIMPVYNERPEYLKCALESILSQTFTNFELIIVDDASEEYVKTIINSYKDPRILYYKQDVNSKICATLNQGMLVSEGKYIAIMHSDDFSVRTRLEREYEVLENNENIGFVNSYSIKKYGKTCRINMPETNSDELKFHLKYIGNNVIHPNVMLRKSILDEAFLWYKNKYVFAEDYKMWVEMIPFCDFYTIPEILTIYNVDINPKRQNYNYQEKCRKAILLENYVSDLDIPLKDLNSTFKNIWNTGNVRYPDYVAIKKALLSQLPKIAKSQFSTKFYYTFIEKLDKTIESFNPYKKEEHEFF